MKKLFMAALILCVFTQLPAQNAPQRNQQGTNKNAPNFVDKNNDGICDNYTLRGPRRANCGNFSARKAQGRNSQNQGRYFTDTNKNGICDNLERNK